MPGSSGAGVSSRARRTIRRSCDSVILMGLGGLQQLADHAIVRADLHVARNQQLLGLGPEQETLRVRIIEKWPDAEGVPRGEQLLGAAVPDGKGELAVEAIGG